MQVNLSTQLWERLLDGTFVSQSAVSEQLKADETKGYSLAITCPAELSAAATVIQFWRPDISPAVWLSVFIFFIVVINFAGVRLYGEVNIIHSDLRYALDKSL
jgi:L-asparagine transporter-like permease